MPELVERSTKRFIATFDPGFADLATSEIRQATGSPQLELELGPGVELFEAQRSFSDFARDWRVRPPIFVRHICPVDVTLPLRAQPQDLDHLQDVVVTSIAAQMDKALSFSVQSRLFADFGYKPFDINTRLAEALGAATGAHVDVRHPRQVVSVVCATEHSHGEFRGYLGLSPVEQNLSDWAGGMRRFQRETDQVSRSEFKLLEALEVFRVELPPRGIALDLGAAPGGWTRILRNREQYVTAIDPGELHPAIEADKGVRHIKTTAEQYLHMRPDHFDLIVNDMRMDARDSARLMVQFADYLYAHGQAIMTLKLPETNRKPVVEHSLSILKRSYAIAGVKQLFHNRSEITLLLTVREDEN